MANHVTSKVVITGDSKELADFEANCMDEVLEGWDKGSMFLDFDKIIPFPKELDGISSGYATIDGKEAKRWRTVDGKDIAISEDDCKELQKKYGADCLYDWNISNWGTKWNSYDFYSSYSDSSSAEFKFSTAWSFPEPIFEKLTEMYPNLTFHVSCFDEGWNFAGRGFFSSKETTFEAVEATNDMYEDVYGYAPDEEDEF